MVTLLYKQTLLDIRVILSPNVFSISVTMVEMVDWVQIKLILYFDMIVSRSTEYNV